MALKFEASLQRDIDRIRGKVTEMSALAEQALTRCIQALVDRSRQHAYAVIVRDQYIDELEKEIDRLCLEFLVRQQPVAGTLRFVYSTIKINLELERVGDYAESIARQSLKLIDHNIEIPSGRLIEIANLSIPMLRDATRAFLEQDPDLAKRTIEVEEAVDLLKSDFNRHMAKLYLEQKIPFESLNPLTMISRRFERVSDQARNICMEVLYMCTGEYAKHPGTEAFRILFVDEHNSCRAQIAEAVANSLEQPKFIFASAGLEPRPVNQETVQFMEAKGLDLSRAVPKAINQVPNLDHYNVIVALSEQVRRAFPRRPRKVVFLDWLVPDPSAVKGAPEEVRAAYEETYQFIRTQVQELVDAILGDPSQPGG